MTSDPSLNALLAQFRACDNYEDRLTFWQGHGLTNEFCYCIPEFNNDTDAGKAGTTFNLSTQIKCRNWNDVKQLPILTIAPFSRDEAKQFVAWALRLRPTMNDALETGQDLISAFEVQYKLIMRQSDKSTFIEDCRNHTDHWVNIQAFDRSVQRTMLTEEMGIDISLYDQLMTNLRRGNSLSLDKYIKLGQIDKSWAEIDTYLFALSQYEYCLFLEQFNSDHNFIRPMKTTSTSADVIEKINSHMIRLFNKQVYGIPRWDLLYELVSKAEVDPTNIDLNKYVNKLYWALKDLYSVEYTDYCYISDIDKTTYLVTFATKRRYSNKVGFEYLAPFTQQYEADRFNRLFLKQPVELLESTPNEFKKIDGFRKRADYSTEEDGSFSIINEVSGELNNESTEKRIEKLFRSVLNSNWSRVTFEKFIKGEGHYEESTIVNRKEQLGGGEASDVEPSIFITLDVRQLVYNAIAQFVEVEQHQDLKALLKIGKHEEQDNATKGDRHNSKVPFKGQQNSLVYIFRQLLDNQKTTSTATEVRDWLCYWFQYVNKGKVSSLSRSSVYDCLTKDSVKPKKESRILLNL